MFRVRDLGFRVQVQDSGARAKDLGFKSKGSVLGFYIHILDSSLGLGAGFSIEMQYEQCFFIGCRV